MNKRNLCTAIAASLGMLALILDGKTALSGAAEGVELCLNTLIPSLFPFFLLSILLTGTLSGQSVSILRPVAKLCKIPAGAESLLAIGLLGGYPVGAQNVALMHRAGQLSDAQAARMVTFCNNAGPAFIFGILGSMFTDPFVPWLLWFIHILSAITVGMVLPGSLESGPTQPLKRQVRVTDAMEKSIRAMGLVCGWVVLMRMILAFLDRWFLWSLPLSAQVAVCGILELSNGCIRLAQLGDEGLRFLLAAAMLSLGGVCVTLQTTSVTDGISKRYYFPGKILQCCVSIVLADLLRPGNSFTIAAIAAVIGIGCILSFRIYEKSSRIPAMVSV